MLSPTQEKTQCHCRCRFAEESQQDIDSLNHAASNVEGVFFNVDKNMWVPDDSIKGISLVPLPPTLPEEASPWVFKRQTSAQYIRNSNDMDCNDAPEKNMMLGEPCYPDQSGFCDCGLTWKSATLCFQCWFTVRTCVGAVARRRYVAVCSCKQFIQWNPATEFIHAISLEEGGMVKLRCISCYLK